jgi:hypothetical protein
MKPPKDLEKMRRELGGARRIAKHYGVGVKRVRAWFIEKGMPIKLETRIAPPPKDFSRVYPTMTRLELMKHYGASHKSISNWISELGLPDKRVPPPPKPKRPNPDGFRKLAPTLSINALSTHYNACGSTVKRWLIELGIDTKKPYNFRMKNRCTAIPSAKNDHPHERAANYLRKFMAVSPCDKDGKYKLGGSFYRVGQNVLSREETIKKAERHMERQKTISYSNSIAS